jgi:cellulose biosynthesis protein BcsQ
MAYRVMIGNHKGGTGKTVGTINLAVALARRGYRVLVVDMDPQGNCSRRLGVAVTEATLTISEVLKAAEVGAAAAAVVPCGFDDYADRIDVIPARFDLENRISEAGVVGAVSRLDRVMRGVDDGYDFTLFDCPPSLGHLVQLVMAASRYALVTIEPEYDGVEGAVRYVRFVSEYGAAVGSPDLAVVGAVVCRVREQLGAHRFQVDGLADTFGSLVWEPRVSEAAVQKDASDTASPLTALGSRAAQLVDAWDAHAGNLVAAVGAGAAA